MHYIIDGYNLFFSLEDSPYPLGEKREAFIEELHSRLCARRIEATLIFDSGKTHRSPFPTKSRRNRLTVVFTPEKISADTYILELLDHHRTPQNQTVVTSDRSLAKKASARKAKTQTTRAFLQKLSPNKKEGSTDRKEGRRGETKADRDRLLAIFLERFEKGKGDATPTDREKSV